MELPGKDLRRQHRCSAPPSWYDWGMRISSVLTPSGIRTVLASLVLLGATNAVAATVVVDREQLQQQLQALTQQVAIAQQQIDQSPTVRVQLTSAVQQLQAAQRQLGELARQLSLAPPAPVNAPQYAPPGAPQYAPGAPQYAPGAPQYAPPGTPQYAPGAPQYAPPGTPQYAPPGAPQYAPPGAPQYAPPGAPQYAPPAPQYPPAAPQYSPTPQPGPPQYAPPAPPTPQYPPPSYQNALGDADFRSLLQQLTSASSNDKLNVLRRSSVGSSFLVDQVARILPLYIYTADRLVALQILTPQILDRPSAFKLLSLFHDSEDREQAQRILFINGALPPPPR